RGAGDEDHQQGDRLARRAADGHGVAAAIGPLPIAEDRPRECGVIRLHAGQGRPSSEPISPGPAPLIRDDAETDGARPSYPLLCPPAAGLAIDYPSPPALID